MEFITNNFGNMQDSIYIGFVGVIAFFWIRAVIWIAKDINARTNNSFLQAISIIIGVIPVFGFFVYLLIRPVNYKYDRLPWRETITMQSIQCPDCGQYNLLNFNYCINCGEKLQTDCKECKNKYSVEFEFCPNCSAPNINVK